MDAPTLALVRHYVREDAWSAYRDLLPVEDDLNTALDAALAVEGAATGVAAYILETVSVQAQRDAAATPQVKRLKDGGEETEFFEARPLGSTNAEAWAARAVTLRTSTAAFVPIVDGWGVA